MHEGAADRAGSRIQILVAAPDREVRSRIMQRERYVADGVRESEADRAAMTRRAARDLLEGQWLAGHIVHARPDDGGDRGLLALDEFADIARAQRCFSLARTGFQQRLGRCVTVPAKLRGDGIAIGGERALLDEDTVSLSRRAIEAREHQVQ